MQSGVQLGEVELFGKGLECCWHVCFGSLKDQDVTGGGLGNGLIGQVGMTVGELELLGKICIVG